MNINIPEYVNEFKPNKKRRFVIYYFIVLPCIIFGLLGLIYCIDNENWGFSIFWFIFAGSAFFAFIGFGMGVHYYTSPEGIYLKRLKKIIFIPHSTIESVDIVEKKQAEDMLLKWMNQNTENTVQDELNIRSFRDVKKVFTNIRHRGKIYSFMSSSVLFYEYQNRFNHKFRFRIPLFAYVKLSCDPVFIKLKNKEWQEGYFISPLDSKGFVEEAKKTIQKILKNEI